jgi:hypothetical protein
LDSAWIYYLCLTVVEEERCAKAEFFAVDNLCCQSGTTRCLGECTCAFPATVWVNVHNLDGLLAGGATLEIMSSQPSRASENSLKTLNFRLGSN